MKKVAFISSILLLVACSTVKVVTRERTDNISVSVTPNQPVNVQVTTSDSFRENFKLPQSSYVSQPDSSKKSELPKVPEESSQLSEGL